MLTNLLIAWGLMAVCVAIHATGLTMAFRWIKRQATPPGGQFWPPTWMLIRVVGWIVFVHLLQIAVWAFYYTWNKAMPDLTSALYFSAVTYTTTGYGDLVLPQEWRLVGAVEALTGILMCGLSTGLFFALFTKAFGIQREEG